MTFSSTMVPALIVGPLRYFFSTYTSPDLFHWNEDEKKRNIDIGHANDFFKVTLGEKPRILVDRGSFQVSKVGVTDNMAEQRRFKETNGLKDKINMMLYQGSAQVLVEARNMGTCEVLADMACHFISWARPEICDSQGFKEFALPMSVSPCQQVERENTEKFQVQVNLPWIKEEHWRVKDDGIAIKNSIIQLLNLEN